MTDEFKMTGGPSELTPEEAARLAELREVIEAYRQAGLEAGRALREIRDRRLWRKWSENLGFEGVPAGRVAEIVDEVTGRGGVRLTRE